MPDMNKKVYTIPEVAEALSVSKNLVRILISNGDLGHIRVGRRVLVPIAALEAFIASGGTRQVE